MSAMPDGIEMHNVSFSYGSMMVLENINLVVHRGDMLGLIGPNGGGKSTLLKLILGFIKPRTGRISVLGKTPGQIKRRLGYVPQQPGFARDFPINVEQTVLLGRLGMGTGQGWLNSLFYRRYSELDYNETYKALREVGTEHLAGRSMDSLSGGQLQRILIARALVADPEILLLDEPTANIDQESESNIFSLLKKLNRRMTILIVSHDLGFISSYVTRVACVNRTMLEYDTESIDGHVIKDLYGSKVRMISPHATHE